MKKLFPLILLAGLILLWAGPTQAAWPDLTRIQLIPPECAQGTGKTCDLDSFLQMFVNFAQLLLGTVAIFTLLIFVWNSFGLATSGGSPNKVEMAKKGMVGAVLGMIIVMGSWALVNTAVCILVGGNASAECAIFGINWSGYGRADCRDQEPYDTGDCTASGVFRLNCSDGPGGSFGSYVVDIQAKLFNYKCPVGTVDGCFGPDTEAAAKNFQAANGLAVDGIVGPSTLAVLNSESARECDESVVAGGENVCCIPFDPGLSCVESSACVGVVKEGNCNNYATECMPGCCYYPAAPLPPFDCEHTRAVGCTEEGKDWDDVTCYDLGCTNFSF